MPIEIRQFLIQQCRSFILEIGEAAGLERHGLQVVLAWTNLAEALGKRSSNF
jgi:hypothetical protein